MSKVPDVKGSRCYKGARCRQGGAGKGVQARGVGQANEKGRQKGASRAACKGYKHKLSSKSNADAKAK